MADHQSTRALANFAATLNAKNLPSDVRQKLGWLFLDYLRVCSIGARLPWSDWSRRYVGQVGKAGKSHALFERETLNPQHATLLNVTFGSSFDGDDTHVGAMLHAGVAAWAAALAIAEHKGKVAPPDRNDPAFKRFVESQQFWDRAMAQAMAPPAPPKPMIINR